MADRISAVDLRRAFRSRNVLVRRTHVTRLPLITDRVLTLNSVLKKVGVRGIAATSTTAGDDHYQMHEFSLKVCRDPEIILERPSAASRQRLSASNKVGSSALALAIDPRHRSTDACDARRSQRRGARSEHALVESKVQNTMPHWTPNLSAAPLCRKRERFPGSG
jgi:hypothetical protein